MASKGRNVKTYEKVENNDIRKIVGEANSQTDRTKTGQLEH